MYSWASRRNIEARCRRRSCSQCSSTRKEYVPTVDTVFAVQHDVIIHLTYVHTYLYILHVLNELFIKLDSPRVQKLTRFRPTIEGQFDTYYPGSANIVNRLMPGRTFEGMRRRTPRPEVLLVDLDVDDVDPSANDRFKSPSACLLFIT